ncbi:hypothetical protein H0H92_005928 [Tricholoma furcatifolium]|nr:hypothetical protein H0H92_005928 [Tricholoma furcatifolium]
MCVRLSSAICVYVFFAFCDEERAPIDIVCLGQHNGDRDTRGPGDFSGEGGGIRNDSAAGEGDDDDEEAEINEPAPPPKRTTSKGKKGDDDEFKPSSGTRAITTDSEPKQRASMSNERSASNPRANNIPASLPFAAPPPQFDHPISSDRLHPAQHQRPYQDHDQPVSKKARLDYSLDLGMPRDHAHGHPIPPDNPLHRTHAHAHEALYMYPAFRRPSSESGHHGPPAHPAAAYPYGPGPGPGAISYPSSPPPHSQYAFHPSTHNDLALGPTQISSWARTHGHGHGHGHGVPDPGKTNGNGGALPPTFFGTSASSPFELPSFVGRGVGVDDARGEPGGPGPSFANAFLEADLQHQHRAGPGRGGGGTGMGTPTATATTSSSFGIDWPTHRPSLPPPVPPVPPVTPLSLQASTSGSGSAGRASAGATPPSAGAGAGSKSGSGRTGALAGGSATPTSATAPSAAHNGLNGNGRNTPNGSASASAIEQGPASAGAGAAHDDAEGAGPGWLELLSEVAPQNSAGAGASGNSSAATPIATVTPPPRVGSAASVAGSGG